jgi:hypothetical protein
MACKCRLSRLVGTTAAVVFIIIIITYADIFNPLKTEIEREREKRESGGGSERR